MCLGIFRSTPARDSGGPTGQRQSAPEKRRGRGESQLGERATPFSPASLTRSKARCAQSKCGARRARPSAIVSQPGPGSTIIAAPAMMSANPATILARRFTRSIDADRATAVPAVALELTSDRSRRPVRVRSEGGPRWAVRRASVRALDTHERAVARPEQEVGLDEGVEHVGAAGLVEGPQLARLRFGQLEAGHFEELRLQAADESFDGFFAHHGR